MSVQDKWAVFEKRADRYLRAKAGADANRLWDLDFFRDRIKDLHDAEGRFHDPSNPTGLCPLAAMTSEHELTSESLTRLSYADENGEWVSKLVTDDELEKIEFTPSNDKDDDSASQMPEQLTKDDLILRLVKEDVTWLYERCVAERIWKADRHADVYFLRKLGEAISKTVTTPTESRGFEQLRLFLFELGELGLVGLTRPYEAVAYLNEDNLPEEEFYSVEWQDAFEAVRTILNEPAPIPGLAGLRQFSNVAEFRKHFESWFDDPKKYFSGERFRRSSTAFEIAADVREKKRDGKFNLSEYWGEHVSQKDRQESRTFCPKCSRLPCECSEVDQT